MVDIREFNDPPLEETIRVGVEKYFAHFWVSMPTVVSEDTKEGHVSMLQPAINGRHLDDTGAKTKIDAYPVMDDAPVHHYGGGRVAHTTPTKKGDEVLAVYSSRPIDSWHQNGGVDNNPVDTRIGHMSDAFMLRGYRSTPRKLMKVAKESSQIRSEDLSNYHDLHPTNGQAVLASDARDDSKKHTHIINKDKGIVGTSTSNIQHLVGASTATLTKTLHRLTGTKIHLN